MGFEGFISAAVGAVLALILTVSDRDAPSGFRTLQVMVMGCGFFAAYFVWKDIDATNHRIDVQQSQIADQRETIAAKVTVIDDQRKVIDQQKKTIDRLAREVARHERRLGQHDDRLGHNEREINELNHAVARLERTPAPVAPAQPPAQTSTPAVDHDSRISDVVSQTEQLAIAESPLCRVPKNVSFRYLRMGAHERQEDKCTLVAGASDVTDDAKVRWLIVPFADGKAAIDASWPNNLLAYVQDGSGYRFLGSIPVVGSRVAGAGFDIFEGKLRAWNGSVVKDGKVAEYKVQFFAYDGTLPLTNLGGYCAKVAVAQPGSWLDQLGRFFSGSPQRADAPAAPPKNAPLLPDSQLACSS